MWDNNHNHPGGFLQQEGAGQTGSMAQTLWPCVKSTSAYKD